jgi:hypothetical protein
MRSFLKNYKKNIVTAFLAVTVVAIGTAQAMPVSLGTAAGFAVLGGSTVTNTGPTVLNGDLGLTPGTAITGFFGTIANEGPGIVNGTVHQTDPAAALAQGDLTTAYNNLAALPFTTHYLVPTDLGGATLTAGVYKFDSSAGVTGTLTLSGPGDFVFQIGSTLTTAGTVLTIGGADAGNVFWQVGSSATLGTNTAFKGSIVALTSITLNTGATILNGRALARNGAVTLDSNIITVPEPATLCLLGLGSLSLIRRKRRA